MKNKILTLIPVILLSAAVILMLTTSFDVKPTVHLWNWFGYEFGLDFTSRMPILRISSVIVAGSIWFWVKRETERQESVTKVEDSQSSKMKQAA